MAIIDQKKRAEKVAEAATRLLNIADFRFWCDALVMDLADKQEEMLAQDGTTLSRSQGAAIELRRVLNAVYGAHGVAERVAAASMEGIQRVQDRTLHQGGRESDQP